MLEEIPTRLRRDRTGNPRPKTNLYVDLTDALSRSSVEPILVKRSKLESSKRIGRVPGNVSDSLFPGNFSRHAVADLEGEP
jgi:hypothetical protein